MLLPSYHVKLAIVSCSDTFASRRYMQDDYQIQLLHLGM